VILEYFITFDAVANFLKILLGVIIGIAAVISFLIVYRAWGLHNMIQAPVCLGKSDTTKDALIQIVNQLKITNLNYQEKFDSINKRLDDFLLFGGLIITLLLAISVSVYFKTEAEVDKHMKISRKDINDDIAASKTIIKGYVTEMQSNLKESAALLQDIRTAATTAKQASKAITPESRPEQG